MKDINHQEILNNILQQLNGLDSEASERILTNALYGIWRNSTFDAEKANVTFNESIKLPRR